MTGSRVVRGGMMLFAGRFGVSLVSLVFYALAARVVDTRADLVPLVLLAIGAELFRIAGGLGLSTALLRHVPRQLAEGRPDTAAAWLRGVFLCRALATALVGGVCWVAGAPMAEYMLGRALRPHEGALIIAFAFLMSLYDVLQVALLARQEFGRHSITTFVTLTGQRVLAFILLLCYGMTGCLVGFAIGAGAGVLLCAFWLRREWLRPGGIVGFPALARHALPYWPQGMARYVFHEGDQLAVALGTSPELLAGYFMAKRIAHGIRMMIDSATDAFRPRLGELSVSEPETIEERFRKAGRFLAYLVIPVTLGTAAVSGPLMRAFGGEKYADAGAILCVLSLAMLAYALFSRYEDGVHMLGRPSDRLKADALVALIAVGGYLITVERIGGLGVALALLAAYSVGALAAGALLRRRRPMAPDHSAETRVFVAGGVMFVIIGGAALRATPLAVLPVLIAGGALIFTVVLASLLLESERREIAEALPGPLGRWAAAVLSRASLVRARGDEPKEEGDDG